MRSVPFLMQPPLGVFSIPQPKASACFAMPKAYLLRQLAWFSTVAPDVSATAAAIHTDKQKYEEIAKKYGEPEKKHDVNLIWIPGQKKLHPFKWISNQVELDRAKPPTPGASSNTQQVIEKNLQSVRGR